METIVVTPSLTSSAANMQVEQMLIELRQLIESTKQQVLVYVNQQVSLQYYSIGKYIVENLHTDTYSDYGKQILVTLSQTLQREYAK